MELSNKTIVITGVSKGLGRELAVRLGKTSPNVILIARSKNVLDQLQQEILEFAGNAPLIIACDISNESEVIKTTTVIQERYDHIDVLINNAGIGIYKF